MIKRHNISNNPCLDEVDMIPKMSRLKAKVAINYRYYVIIKYKFGKKFVHIAK